MEQMPAPAPRMSNGTFLFLLLALCILAGIVVTLVRIPTFTQGGGFDAQKEALRLAIHSQRWRNTHARTPGNYGQASITIVNQDGTVMTLDTSDVYEGFDGPASDPNRDHSERKEHDFFLLPTLKIYAHNGIADRAKEIHIVIFSQITVCKTCQAEMRGWLAQYRQVVGKKNAAKVSVTVWELTGSFNPKAPRWTVVADEADVQEVPITFLP